MANSACLLASAVPVLPGTPASRLQMDRQKPQIPAAARHRDVRCPTLGRIALSKGFQIIVAAIGRTPVNGEPCRHVAKARLRTVPARTAGFLLTAARNWTGMATNTGGRLAALAGLWIAGRVLVQAV